MLFLNLVIIVMSIFSFPKIAFKILVLMLIIFILLWIDNTVSDISALDFVEIFFRFGTGLRGSQFLHWRIGYIFMSRDSSKFTSIHKTGLGVLIFLRYLPNQVYLVLIFVIDSCLAFRT